MATFLTKKTVIDVSNQLKLNNRKVVLTHGSFDLFHVGHSEFLKQSKVLGEYLIVGIDSDRRVQKYKNTNRPIIPFEQRMEILLEVKSIDFVFELDTLDMTNEYFIKMYNKFNPSVLTCGRNFAFQKDLKERQKMLKECNFYEITHKFDHLQSTTNIIKQ